MLKRALNQLITADIISGGGGYIISGLPGDVQNGIISGGLTELLCGG